MLTLIRRRSRLYTSIAAQWLIYDYWLGGKGLRLADPSVAAVAVTLFVRHLGRLAHKNKLADLRRFEVIRQMNHHIRNAFQVLAYQPILADGSSKWHSRRSRGSNGSLRRSCQRFVKKTSQRTDDHVYRVRGCHTSLRQPDLRSVYFAKCVSAELVVILPIVSVRFSTQPSTLKTASANSAWLMFHLYKKTTRAPFRHLAFPATSLRSCKGTPCPITRTSNVSVSSDDDRRFRLQRSNFKSRSCNKLMPRL